MTVPPSAPEPDLFARTDMPTWARLHLTHAAMQTIADEVGADILHVKGPAVAADLRSRPRMSTDVDVLVRPEHVQRFLAGLTAHGWHQVTSFAEGSSFGHAANYGHPHWAHVDVHRFFPGPTREPSRVFDTLWDAHTSQQIAHRACAVPDLVAQVLVLALHEARSHRARGTFEAWDLSDADRRAAVWTLARDVGAEVPLAAAVGRLEEFQGRRDYRWWAFWSSPVPSDRAEARWAEWQARWSMASGLRERAAVATAMVRVNRTHLRLQLGHEPNSAEVRHEYRNRIAAGWHAVSRQARASLTRLRRLSR